MNLHRLIVPIVLVGPFSLGFSVAQAEPTSKTTTTTTTTEITTAVPAPKEVVAEPEGYVTCKKVSSGWFGKVWHHEHKVCRYDTRTASIKGEAWVDGHWECSQYTGDQCTTWDWTAGHWVDTYSEDE